MQFNLDPGSVDSNSFAPLFPVLLLDRAAASAYPPAMVHENLSASIDNLSSRIIAIRDSL